MATGRQSFMQIAFALQIERATSMITIRDGFIGTKVLILFWSLRFNRLHSFIVSSARSIEITLFKRIFPQVSST